MHESTLADYTFLPWLRQGIASEISHPDGVVLPGERASVDVRFNVNGQPVSRAVELVGPGDIIGVNPRAISKCEPRPSVTDFEPNYLPYIEFYEEDFPWRYTPARAVGVLEQSRLRPWLFLAVLSDDEFRDKTPGGPLPAIELIADAATVLPPSGQTWAWAHVHISGNILAGATTSAAPAEVQSAAERLEGVLTENTDRAASRLICPRRLRANAVYHAFLIPAFENGRLAGLGQDVTTADGLAPSWGAGQTDFPVYHRWSFKAGDGGDFESLVDLLAPRKVDPRVGVREMDVSDPGYDVGGMTGTLAVMGLEGALKSPETISAPQQWPPTGTSFNNPAAGSPGRFLLDLEQVVNLQFALRQKENASQPHPDPIVSPPLYGQWHAGVEQLAVREPGWVNELNGDPRQRAAAGCGTDAIQQNQERYMQQAWAQLGDILQANQRLRQLQLGLTASFQLYRKHLLPMADAQILSFTLPAHTRIAGGAATIAGQVRASRLPAAALDPAFRKIIRPRGAMMKKAAAAGAVRPAEVIVRLNDQRLSAAPALPPRWRHLNLEEFAGAQTAALREVNWRPSLDRTPTRPAFVLAAFGRGMRHTAAQPTRDSSEAGLFRRAVTNLITTMEAAPSAVPPRPPVSLVGAAQVILAALDPARALTLRARFLVKIPASVLDNRVRPPKTIAPVMAHPVFAEPMYRPLRDRSADLLVPNLALIPNNTVSLMEVNDRFIESYLAGVNHEMARELLWREFPTDQRGSYFRQFWDVGDRIERDPAKTAREIEEAFVDVKALHTWDAASALGTHSNLPAIPGAQPGEARLVVVVRGDVLKKYPTAVIFAQQAMWTKDAQGRDIRVLDDSEPAVNLQTPVFKAEIEPDIRFLGFNLTASIVKGSPVRADNNPGWFIVIQERPGEPRFGLDNRSADTPDRATAWNELAWEHIVSFETLGPVDLTLPVATDTMQAPDSLLAWGRNAADMAYILYQVPVMVAFHAADMLNTNRPPAPIDVPL
jgi:hypothetical protein